MEEQSINELLVYKTLRNTVSGLILAGRDPIEIVVALNALSIETASEHLKPIVTR